MVLCWACLLSYILDVYLLEHSKVFRGIHRHFICCYYREDTTKLSSFELHRLCYTATNICKLQCIEKCDMTFLLPHINVSQFIWIKSQAQFKCIFCKRSLPQGKKNKLDRKVFETFPKWLEKFRSLVPNWLFQRQFKMTGLYASWRPTREHLFTWGRACPALRPWNWVSPFRNLSLLTSLLTTDLWLGYELYLQVTFPFAICQA